MGCLHSALACILEPTKIEESAAPAYCCHCQWPRSYENQPTDLGCLAYACTPTSVVRFDAPLHDILICVAFVKCRRHRAWAKQRCIGWVKLDGPWPRTSFEAYGYFENNTPSRLLRTALRLISIYPLWLVETKVSPSLHSWPDGRSRTPWLESLHNNWRSFGFVSKDFVNTEQMEDNSFMVNHPNVTFKSIVFGEAMRNRWRNQRKEDYFISPNYSVS